MKQAYLILLLFVLLVDYDRIRDTYKECGKIMHDFKTKILEELEYIAERLLPALSVGVNTEYRFRVCFDNGV